MGRILVAFTLKIQRSECAVFPHWKKWSHFDLKSWVTGGTKIWPGIPNNWRIFESNWLDIESQIDNLTLIIELIWLSISSQFDSQYRVNLTLSIESQTCQFDSDYWVKLTLNIESIWLSVSSLKLVNLTLIIESNWLSISSQFDSQYRVSNLSIWLSISSQFNSNILQFLGIPGQIFSSTSDSTF